MMELPNKILEVVVSCQTIKKLSTVVMWNFLLNAEGKTVARTEMVMETMSLMIFLQK